MEKPNLRSVLGDYDGVGLSYSDIVNIAEEYGRRMFNYALTIALTEARVGMVEEEYDDLEREVLKHKL